jgi:hypothetical protein
LADRIPRDIDLQAWEERNRLCGEQLPRIALSTGVERQKLICELAGSLFDSWARRRVTLVQNLENIPFFSDDQDMCLSMIVMPSFPPALALDDFDTNAIDLTIAGRKRYWLAEAIKGIHGAGEAASESDVIGSKKKRRKDFVLPIISGKGMSQSKWATNAGVDPSVVYDYLKGVSNPRAESRKVMAEAIGVKETDLPN